MTLAEKNNNPFNLLQINPSKWRGLIGREANGLLQFDTLLNGIRAGFINLIQKVNNGSNTIEKIFNSYGDPGHEEEYKKFVSDQTGIGRNTTLSKPSQLLAIGKAIVKMEAGKYWVTDSQMIQGLDAALQSYSLKENIKRGTIGLGVLIAIVVSLYPVSVYG